MKGFILVLVVAGAMTGLRAAEESSSAPMEASAASSLSKTNEPNPALSAEYVKLKRREVELASRIAVLAELADEHAAKADALKSAQVDKAEWEKQLAQELRDKISAASKELGTATKEGMDFEETHGITAPTGTGAFGAATAANADEMAYYSLLQTRLARLQQELVAAFEVGNGYTAELQTNSSPENLSRISFLVQENGWTVRQLEREQFDLQLRKLEFRMRRK